MANFLDLAIYCEKKDILEHLVSHGFTNHRDEFEEFLVNYEFVYPGDIFSEVLSHDYKCYQSILNNCVDIEIENNQDKFIMINFNALDSPNVLETVLVNGEREIFLHPVVEAQTRLFIFLSFLWAGVTVLRTSFLHFHLIVCAFFVHFRRF